MILSSILVDVLDVILPKGRVRQVMFSILIFATTILVGAVVVINQLSKKDIKESQIQIEKNRIVEIDKQLSSIYGKIYKSDDSLSGFNNDRYLDEVKFLKSQRTDAISNIDNVNNNPDGEIIIFAGTAGVLVLSLVVFFSISFKSDFDYSDYDKLISRYGRYEQKENQNNHDFLAWATSEELIGEDTSSLNITRARVLKSIHDLSYGSIDKEELLKQVVDYGMIVKRQSNQTSIINDKILSNFKDIKTRLNEECNRLNKQALLNLFICFIIAFLLIGYIGYNSISGIDIKDIPDIHVFIMKYLPRLVSIIGLISIFVYFVNLYKANISDVKYYQNELTNIEMKLIALHLSLDKGDAESVINLINSYSVVERNTVVTVKSSDIDVNVVNSYSDIAKNIFEKMSEISASLKK